MKLKSFLSKIQLRKFFSQKKFMHVLLLFVAEFKSECTNLKKRKLEESIDLSVNLNKEETQELENDKNCIKSQNGINKLSSIVNDNSIESTEDKDEESIVTNGKDVKLEKDLSGNEEENDFENESIPSPKLKELTEDEIEIRKKLFERLQNELCSEEMKLLLLKKIQHSQLKENLAQQQSQLQNKQVNSNLVNQNLKNHVHLSRPLNIQQQQQINPQHLLANNLNNLSQLRNQSRNSLINSQMNRSGQLNFSGQNATNGKTLNNLGRNSPHLQVNNNLLRRNSANNSINNNVSNLVLGLSNQLNQRNNSSCPSPNLNNANNKCPTPTPSTPHQSFTPNQQDLVSPAQQQAAAKLALKKQIEKTLLQIPNPKPLTQDIHFIPNAQNQEFIYYYGLETVVDFLTNTTTSGNTIPVSTQNGTNVIANENKPPTEPFLCVQCGTDFTPTWKYKTSPSADKRKMLEKKKTKQIKEEKPLTSTENNEINGNSDLEDLEENDKPDVICEGCVSQNNKKQLKAEHTQRLKAAFTTASQQEKEFEIKLAAMMATAQSTVTPPPSTPPPSKEQQLQQLVQQQQQQQQLRSLNSQRTQQSNQQQQALSKTSKNSNQRSNEHVNTSSNHNNNANINKAANLNNNNNPFAQLSQLGLNINNLTNLANLGGLSGLANLAQLGGLGGLGMAGMNSATALAAAQLLQQQVQQQQQHSSSSSRQQQTSSKNISNHQNNSHSSLNNRSNHHNHDNSNQQQKLSGLAAQQQLLQQVQLQQLLQQIHQIPLPQQQQLLQLISQNPANISLLAGSLSNFGALVWDIKFSPHGYYFASCGHDRTARLWATDNYQPLRLFAGHISDVDCLQIHPNSNYVATGSSDRSVRLWDVLNGQCVRYYTGHKSKIFVLQFTNCGKFLVSAGQDKAILFWHLGHGYLVAHLTGHHDTIFTMSFSRDGNILATAGNDDCINLWDANKLLDELDSEELNISQFPVVKTNSNDILLGSYRTKSTNILTLHFTRRNLLLASGIIH
ncbi:hypothetical protein RND71_043991 [Anisodus tanguticus]|uniref:Leucine-rich repeat and WD repeat-containing protein 1 n=1 Tax=Anisodus tanguticus TaxID=243964 RepID=A0AAE1QQF4_9SOLA|nr:hypothetical protein RND71_043991 [Anisodus tanguticus]